MCGRTSPSAPMARPAALLLAVLLAGCDSVGTNAPSVDASPDPWVEMLDAVNAARAEGQRCGGEAFPPVGPLVWNDRLTLAAERHTADMARTRSFDHVGSDGSRPADRVTRAGYAWRLVGENIAHFQRNVPEVVEDWVESPSHCRNLMDARYAEMGAAQQDLYWTQVFGLAR